MIRLITSHRLGQLRGSHRGISRSPISPGIQGNRWQPIAGDHSRDRCRGWPHSSPGKGTGGQTEAPWTARNRRRALLPFGDSFRRPQRLSAPEKGLSSPGAGSLPDADGNLQVGSPDRFPGAAPWSHGSHRGAPGGSAGRRLPPGITGGSGSQ